MKSQKAWSQIVGSPSWSSTSRGWSMKMVNFSLFDLTYHPTLNSAIDRSRRALQLCSGGRGLRMSSCLRFGSIFQEGKTCAAHSDCGGDNPFCHKSKKCKPCAECLQRSTESQKWPNLLGKFSMVIDIGFHFWISHLVDLNGLYKMRYSKVKSDVVNHTEFSKQILPKIH